MNSGGCRGFSLPDIGSPVSDQRFVFAQANCERWNEMLLAITSDVVALENFDDGNWLPRVLPIYDALSNLLHPKYYGSLTGALVNVSVIVYRIMIMIIINTHFKIPLVRLSALKGRGVLWAQK